MSSHLQGSAGRSCLLLWNAKNVASRKHGHGHTHNAKDCNGLFWSLSKTTNMAAAQVFKVDYYIWLDTQSHTHTIRTASGHRSTLNVTECSRKSLWPLNSDEVGSSQWAHHKHHWACVGMVWERLVISLRSENNEIYAQKCQYNLTSARDATAVSEEMFVYSQCGQNGIWHLKKVFYWYCPTF